MARINNLTNFLTDVAIAIKTKKGDNANILASEFDAEILSLPSQGKYQTKSITITSNDTTTIIPDTGYDAIKSLVITTNVPVTSLQTKSYSFTQNTSTTLTPDPGYAGFSSININVNVPTSEDIKLFDTVAHMQADPDPSEGDLAVVYRNEIQPVTEDSEFNSCVFPNTVVLDEAFSGNINGSFRAVDSKNGRFNGDVSVSSSRFRFDGFGDTMVRVEYTSTDGITYTRTDGGEELQEFGTTIKWEPHKEFNNVIGNFMKIGGNYFDGLYEYKSNEYVMTKNQLNATSDYVYEKTFYGKNGVETGTLGIPDNSFADTNAEVYNKIQNQYENMEPRILTDTDKTIDKNIYFIPVKRNGTPLLDTSNVTNMYFMFQGCKNLTTIPELNTSNVTDMRLMFSGCTSLTIIPKLDTSKVTYTGYMFYGCSNLTAIPELNTSKVTNTNKMFYNCTNLTTIPLLDISEVGLIDDMFGGCPNLSDDSLNIIMQMCINATSYTGPKTLKIIGLTSEQADKCKTLSNYSAFTSAGWTTGY